MPPTAQRLREASAVVLLVFGVVSTLFNAITFLFGPNGCASTGIGAMTCVTTDGATIPFSYRALGATGALLNPVVIVSVAGAVVLVHVQSRARGAKAVAVTGLITVAVAGLLGLVALFASFGADREAGYMKTTNFFVGLAELAVTAVAIWMVLGYVRQYGPPRPVGPYGQQPQGNQWNQPSQQQWQQWQQPPTGAPGGNQWGPPPQQPWQSGPQQS